MSDGNGKIASGNDNADTRPYSFPEIDLEGRESGFVTLRLRRDMVGPVKNLLARVHDGQRHAGLIQDIVSKMTEIGLVLYGNKDPRKNLKLADFIVLPDGTEIDCQDELAKLAAESESSAA